MAFTHLSGIRTRVERAQQLRMAAFAPGADAAERFALTGIAAQPFELAEVVQHRFGDVRRAKLCGCGRRGRGPGIDPGELAGEATQ